MQNNLYLQKLNDQNPAGIRWSKVKTFISHFINSKTFYWSQIFQMWVNVTHTAIQMNKAARVTEVFDAVGVIYIVTTVLLS